MTKYYTVMCQRMPGPMMPIWRVHRLLPTATSCCVPLSSTMTSSSFVFARATLFQMPTSNQMPNSNATSSTNTASSSAGPKKQRHHHHYRRHHHHNNQQQQQQKFRTERDAPVNPLRSAGFVDHHAPPSNGSAAGGTLSSTVKKTPNTDPLPSPTHRHASMKSPQDLRSDQTDDRLRVPRGVGNGTTTTTITTTGDEGATTPSSARQEPPSPALLSPPLYTAADIEPILLAMVVSLVPYAPQSVRVSYIYQALQASWRELLRVVRAITTTVDTFHQRRVLSAASSVNGGSVLPSSNGASVERGQDWWESWELVLLDGLTQTARGSRGSRGTAHQHPSTSSTTPPQDGGSDGGIGRQDRDDAHSSAGPKDRNSSSSRSSSGESCGHSDEGFGAVTDEDSLGHRVRLALQLQWMAPPSFSHGLPYTAGATPWFARLPILDGDKRSDHVEADVLKLKRLWQLVLTELDNERSAQNDKHTPVERRRNIKTADRERLELSEAPRRCIRESYGSLREFLRVHSNRAASIEAVCEGGSITEQEEQHPRSLHRSESRESSEESPMACDAALSELRQHPLVYSGLFLSQDGLFITRALSRVDAGVAFSVFYSLLQTTPNTASPSRAGISSKGLGGSARAENDDEENEEDMMDDDVRSKLCERRRVSPLQRGADGVSTAQGGWRGGGGHPSLSGSPNIHPSSNSSAASLFSCRPLMEVESLLECAIPFDFEPPPAPIPVVDETMTASSTTTTTTSTSTSTASSSSSPTAREVMNIFSPEMLIPILPSYFVPMHRLGPRLPAGYTPAHVRELFGRMTKHVETVTLPPLPAPAADSGVYLRLHEGLREHNDRVVQLSDPLNWDTVLRVHHAPDYLAYRPNPALLHVFRALFLVPAPPAPSRSSVSSTTTTTTAAVTDPASPMLSHDKKTRLPPSPAASSVCARVIRNEWLPLRDVVERAPRHIREALLPLRASHTLLFFAQMQHYFQFSPESGGLIRLAGHSVNTPNGVSSANSDEPLLQLGVLHGTSSNSSAADAGMHGVPITGLGRHNTPTPIAVAEVAALLQKQGCVYVADLERCRTFGGEEHDRPLGVPWARRLLLGPRAHGGGSSLVFSVTNATSRVVSRPALLAYLMNRGDEDEDPLESGWSSGGGSDRTTSSSSVTSLFLSDYTKREILHFYGSLRRFLAVHHGEVFSLRLAPLADGSAALETPRDDDNNNDDGNHNDNDDEPTARRAKRARRGFANTLEIESADFVQQIPAEALVQRPSRHPSVVSSSSDSLLDSPRLMVELWSKYEERQAAANAMAAASGAGGGSIGMGSLSTSAAPPGAGAPAGASRSASSSPYLSSAALSALTLEQQLEYAFSIHDRRRIQKLRRQIAQRNDPEAAYTDTEVLFEAFLRYLPPARHISLRFLLRHLPTSITDFLPSNMTTWLKRFESQGRIQIFEYKFRHHIHLLRPGLPLPDGALRKTFTDDELVRIVAGDIQQRHPRPARMAFLYGALPLGAKDVIRTKYKTLQTFLMRYPEHFIIIAESKSERSSLVKVVNPPAPLQMAGDGHHHEYHHEEDGRQQQGQAVMDWGAGDGAAAPYAPDPYVGGLTGSPSEADLMEEEERERAMLLQELGDELKESMRWH